MSNPASISLAGHALFTTAGGPHPAGELSLSPSNNKSAPGHAKPLGSKPLPPVQAEGLAALQTSSKKSAPYINELKRSLGHIKTFLEANMAPGQQRKNALEALGHFTSQRLAPANLNLITLNQNRSNLQQLALALNNPEISSEKKLSACVELAQGLGVCAEGECLNIAQATAMLTNSETGLAGHIVEAKNQLIDQHLLQAVRASHNNSQSDVVKSLEIHDVQCLKNAVAHQWGLTSMPDRHMSASYQARLAPAVSAALQELITPRALAEVVADKLEQALVNQTQGGLKSGMPSADLLTAPLEKAIQAEFGQHIELAACLELSDDYTAVALAPRQAIIEHLMEGFQDVGLLPEDSSPAMLAKAELPPPGLMAERCTGLGVAARPQIYTPQAAKPLPIVAEPLPFIDLALFFLGARPAVNTAGNHATNQANRKAGQADKPGTQAGPSLPLGHDFQRFGVEVALDQDQNDDRAKGHQ